MRLHVKKILLRFRDSFFSALEAVALVYESSVTSKDKINFVVIGPRPGRGLSESVSDSEFIITFPKQHIPQLIHLRHNSRFWIFSSLKLLRLSNSNRKLKILLIQYVHSFHKFPSLRLLEFLESRGSIITKVWLDSWSEEIWRSRILPCSHIGKFNVISDIPNNPMTALDQSHSYEFMPTPILILPRVPFEERDTFLYYSGGRSVSGLYKSRGEILDKLSIFGFPVAGQSYDRDNPGDRPTYHEYRNSLSRSKIGLNFTWKNESNIITGRTWEILSSAVLLLQNSSSILNDFFDEDVHYVAFGSLDELVEKLRFFESNPNVIEKISLAGQSRYLKLFGNNTLWRNFLTNS